MFIFPLVIHQMSEQSIIPPDQEAPRRPPQHAVARVHLLHQAAAEQLRKKFSSVMMSKTMS